MVIADLTRCVPPTTSVRHPTWDDLAAVVDLHAACARARASAVTLRRGDLQARWWQLDSLADAVVAHDPDGRLVAYRDLERHLDTDRGVLEVGFDGRVHPRHTGMGLGRCLVDTVTATALEQARLAACTTVHLTTTVDDGDDRALAFFTRRGFTPVRHLLTLRLDLHAAPPAPRVPAGVRLRAYRPGWDDTRLWQAHQAAFATSPTALPLRRADLVRDRLAPVRHDPGLVLVAEPTSAVGRAAIVGLAICRSGAPGAPNDGLVRDLGVVPAWRGTGLGMALLRAAFRAFRERDLTGASLAVDDVSLTGPVALYRRAGMRIVRRTDVLTRRLTVREV